MLEDIGNVHITATVLICLIPSQISFGLKTVSTLFEMGIDL